MNQYNLFQKLVEQELRVSLTPEHQFNPKRKWRFDYAILSHKVAIEIEGGIYSNGRHTRPKGYIGDMDKYNSAQCLGWIVLRFSSTSIMKKETLDTICDALNIRS